MTNGLCSPWLAADLKRPTLFPHPQQWTSSEQRLPSVLGLGAQVRGRRSLAAGGRNWPPEGVAHLQGRFRGQGGHDVAVDVGCGAHLGVPQELHHYAGMYA